MKKRDTFETLPSDLDWRVGLRSFPSTRYQGSKRKIVPWLWDHLRNLDFSSALDVFGGTGTVSYLFKKMGKAVTYNDVLRFNHQIGLAIIENDHVTLDRHDIELVQRPLVKSVGHFVKDTFDGIYFTNKENEWIDNTIARIRILNDAPRTRTYKQALLYYALFQSCLIKRPFNLFHRDNLYLRLAKVKRRFGNKTSWEVPFDDRFTGFCEEANRLVLKGIRPCEAIRYDALEIPNARYDLVYIDPPYLTKRGSNESSDYLSCYHFLEGLCDYDAWGARIDYESPNLRFQKTGKDPWVSRDENMDAFDVLFEKFRKSIIVVSYKKFGIPSIQTLVRMLRRHGKKVRSHSRHYKYALNHQNGEAKLNREVLLIAE